MGRFRDILRRFRFGYDAVNTTGRRQPPPPSNRSEDYELLPAQRSRLIAQSRNIHRNFTIAGWMIRRHLDYVSTFSFRATTGIPELDTQVERLVAWWSLPANCDVTGRHSLGRQIRLAEQRRTIDGDVFAHKLDDGRIQWIEGDRVATPIGGVPGMDPKYLVPKYFVQGVRLDDAGRPLAFAVNNRLVNMLVFDRMVPADFIEQHAYFDRFDQVRGISPMAAAINTLRDVYEGCDYALAKMKVAQLFALAFYRESDDQTGTLTQEGDAERPAYSVDFGKGPIKLDLEPGDRAEFLESKSPATEFQTFTQTMIGAALKGLDIPYSFYDESFTNYSGARQALLQYEQSASIKRNEVCHLLDRLTAWRLGLFVLDGQLTLPAGLGVDQLGEWVPRGVPWIDPLKEVNADIAAIGAGLTSRQRRCKERGDDWFDIVQELAVEQDTLKSLGLSVNVAPANAQIVEIANG